VQLTNLSGVPFGNTSLIDLYPASAVGLCLINYKLEKLTGQQFQGELSPSSPSGNSELKPPPCVWKSKLRNP